MREQVITSYGDACRYLDDLQMHKIKLGLEAMRATLANLGSPELRCPAIHVAGTNGKGSVCTMLRSMLSGAGYRTGLYTSPHLSSVRERFRIDDRFIGEDEFARLLERVRQSLGGRKITYFECTTALAFTWFAENCCDVVVLETGLGGRLDATNVLTPLVSVITTVSLDHEQYLGTSIEQIAFEKAGIIKGRIPVISGVADDPARTVIELSCAQHSAPLRTLHSDFSPVTAGDSGWTWRGWDETRNIDNLPPPKNGVWQLDNSACAVAAAVVLRSAGFLLDDEAIRSGLTRAFWPGRMEYLERPIEEFRRDIAAGKPGAMLRFLLDGAHNQAAVACLITAIKEQFSYDRLIVVWACMADKKNYREMVREMAGTADILLLTRPDNERAASPEDLAAAIGKDQRPQIDCCDTVEAALARATSLARPDDLVVAAGSLYLVGAVRRLLVGEVVGND